VEKQLLPLAVAIANGILIAVAGLAGAFGMLVTGGWLALLLGVLGLLAAPLVLRWLLFGTWLLALPSMFASHHGHQRTGRLFWYLTDLYCALLIALWSGAVLWLVFRGSAPWWSLAWGYAVAFGPQFVLCVMPFSPPVVVLLFFVAQVAFACAWVLIAMGVIGMGEAVWAALTLSLAVPVVTQTSRWLELTTIK